MATEEVKAPDCEATFDRSIFNSTYHTVVVSVEKKQTSAAKKALAAADIALVKMANFKPIGPDPKSSAHNVIILDSGVAASDATAALATHAPNVTCTTREEDFPVTYDNMTYRDALDVLLPPGLERPASFETVGHIAHLNLLDGHEKYRKVIGALLVDKFARLETVVNKKSEISNEFRVFPMEVIGGEDRLETTVRESGCAFQLDYGKVYWNSRLGTEHQRLVDEISALGKRVIADMFCGIGPFSVPLLKNGHEVWANDLNPDSIRYLKKNASANCADGVRVGRFHPSCDDARAFMRDLIGAGVGVTDVIMNLPAMSHQFLDVFVGGWTDPPTVLPKVHCYVFATIPTEADHANATFIAEADRMVREVLGVPVQSVDGGKRRSPDLTIDSRVVRDVAPNKRMVLTEFTVPVEIAVNNGKR